jgi:penicillin-binding protein 2
MYSRRIKIFVILNACLLLVFFLRLGRMQLQSNSFYQDKIAELKLQKGRSRQFRTVRGRILDRNKNVLAVDEPAFQLHISYELSSFMDERVRRAKLLRVPENPARPDTLPKAREQLEAGLDKVEHIISRCTRFGLEPEDIKNRITQINDRIWNLRTFLAWVRNDPDPKILRKYANNLNRIPLSEAIASFESRFPDENQRLVIISKVEDIADMDKTWPLLELKTNDDIFAAQLEFLDADTIQILPQAQRAYPYGSAAAQTIGWVGRAQPRDRELFANDRLSSYLGDEISGRDGVEYVCEAVLRGRRGEVIYDIDRQLISRTETELGKDVLLTLDIELQKKIEDYLADCDRNPDNCRAPVAAVVIEVVTGDILALVSTPVYDLNRARYDYAVLSAYPNEPLRNRAIYRQYPPGSVIKPLILIAGLESGKITPREVISCPAKKAPRGWPSCWVYNKYGTCHDDKWRNYARNAIRGSCNIFFSRLADRIEPLVLQQWFLKFGYGKRIPLPPHSYFAGLESADRPRTANHPLRNLKQAPGIISSGNSADTILPRERRYFGIGQGNLRVTPLQVANAMAAIARDGLYKSPRLFIDDPNDLNSDYIALNISRETLAVVRDGMSAVVGEPGGTAYREFQNTHFAEQGVEVFGKTGSTQEPENAWFAGFAEDNEGRAIALAVLVEGGEHGSSDAAPLAARILQFCIDTAYLGQAAQTPE